MGADGGVAWVELRVIGEASGSAVYELLGPFDPFNHSGMDSADTSRWEWIQEDARPERLYGGYGTDLPDCVTLDALGEFCHALRERLTDPVYGLDPETATFGDVIVELETAQSWLTSRKVLRVWLSRLRSECQPLAGHWNAPTPPFTVPTDPDSIYQTRVIDWIGRLVTFLVCEEDRDKRLRREHPERDWHWTPLTNTEETWT